MGEPQYPAPPVQTQPVELGADDSAGAADAVQAAPAQPEPVAEEPQAEAQPQAAVPPNAAFVQPQAGEFTEPEPEVAQEQQFAPEPAEQLQPLGLQEAGVVRTASNASPGLPANAQAAVARAHALLSHFEDAIHIAKTDLEKYVPHGFRQAARDEVALFIRSLL